jgi:hypothetical protein
VRPAAFTSEIPLTPGGSTSAFDLRTADGVITAQASPRVVSAGYFAALGLEITSGRPLAESDGTGSQPVVVVNEAFARRYLGDAPLGARVPMRLWGQSQSGEAVVVGVAADVRYVGTSTASLPELYFSHRQIEVGVRTPIVTLVARGDGDPTLLVSALRSAVREADDSLVPEAVMTLEDRLTSMSLARPRLYAALLGGFAVLALLVAGVGLFGVLSYLVAQRTRELGIRAALGARPRDLVRVVVNQGIGLTVAGLVAGIGASLVLTRFIEFLLYGVGSRDVWTYLVVSTLLLIVAVAACVAPARRAARLDPLRAMRG